MVLILSVQNDLSTNHVIAWLDYMNIPWLRINGIDDIAFKSLEYKDNQIIRFEILINECILDLTKVTAYWYRRGWLNIIQQQSTLKISENEVINFEIHDYLKRAYKYFTSSSTISISLDLELRGTSLQNKRRNGKHTTNICPE